MKGTPRLGTPGLNTLRLGTSGLDTTGIGNPKLGIALRKTLATKARNPPPAGLQRGLHL